MHGSVGNLAGITGAPDPNITTWVAVRSKVLDGLIPKAECKFEMHVSRLDFAEPKACPARLKLLTMSTLTPVASNKTQV